MLVEDLERFAQSFKNEHDIALNFTDEAKDQLVSEALKEEKTIRSLCELKFKDYQHGLSIIARNTGTLSFSITAEAAQNPDEALSQWVVESFKAKEQQSSES